LQSFLIIFADAHDFTDGAHLGAELIFNAAEFLKGPAGKFNNDVIAGGCIFFERPIPPIGDFVERQAAGQQGRNHRNRKACCLGSQCRRARCARIDFNHGHASSFGIVGKLDIGAANDADGVHDGIGILL